MMVIHVQVERCTKERDTFFGIGRVRTCTLVGNRFSVGDRFQTNFESPIVFKPIDLIMMQFVQINTIHERCP
jgi:hypothetical protein